MNKETILNHLHHCNDTHKDNGFVFVSLFGSYARGTEDIFSDIDITYKINHDIFYKDDAFAKLDKIAEIKKKLENKFHKKVDLIPANSKNKQIQSTLEQEQITL